MNGLKKAWQAWLRFGRMIGDIIGRLVLTIFYFTLFVPFGLGMRLVGDPLELRHKHKPGGATRWIERKTRDLVLDDSRRGF